MAEGIIGSNAASSAASKEQAAYNQALALQQGIYNDTKSNIQPYINTGGNALQDLSKLLGIGQPGGYQATSPVLQMLGVGGPGPAGSINPSTFQGSPGYNYQLQQGTNAVTNSAAANGGLGGNALRQLQTTGQGIANQSWNQYLGNVGNAWQQNIGNVSGVAGMGQNAVNSLGSFGQNFAKAGGADQIGAGEAQASGIIGSANAITGGIQGALQAIMGGMNGGMGGGGGGGAGGGGGGSSSGFMSMLANLFNSSGGGGNTYGTVPATGQPYAIGTPYDSF